MSATENASPAAVPRRRTPALVAALVQGHRLLKREWRAGELGLLGVALVIGVSCLTAVTALSDRLDRAMHLGANELLAADLVVGSTTPIPVELESWVRARGLTTARTVSFRTIVVANEAFQLGEAKAVDASYPLRGTLQVRERAVTGASAIAPRGPLPGEAWLEARLAAALGAAPGDALELGDLELRFTRFIDLEPDRGGDAFNIAPRLMFNLDDLGPSGLIRQGSRARYRLLIAGRAEDIASAREAMTARLSPNQRVQGVADARPEIRQALDRAKRFLGLAALSSVFLAGVAIAVAANRYAQRHLDTAALLRTLGASHGTVLVLFASELALLGAGAAVTGAALGYAAQFALAGTLGPLLMTGLPAPGAGPGLLGVAVGMLLLLGFVLAPLVALERVPPMRILRRTADERRRGGWITALAPVGVCLLLLIWQARDLQLVTYLAAGGAAAVGLMYLAGVGLVSALRPLRHQTRSVWRYGLANIARRRGTSVGQMVAFGFGLSLLLTLSLVRDDLMSSWRASLPPDAPNFFLLNIQAADLASLESFLAARDLERAPIHPMIPGRLIRHDDRPVSPENYPESRAQRLVARDFSLSYSNELKPYNRIVAGAWRPDPAQPDRRPLPSLSVEVGIAKALGFSLGDTLTFLAAGRELTGRITSLREVDWDSFRVNFFVEAEPSLLADLPATHLTSFHVPPDHRDALLELVRRFPSVTVVDVDALLGKVREIMAQAGLGIQLVFLFTLAAGVVVLASGVQATLDERRHEAAILRVMGASRGRLLAGLAVEFATLGLASGLLAAIVATGLGALIASELLRLSYQPDLGVFIAGLAVGLVCIGSAGLLGTRGVLDTPPTDSLRRN